MPQYIKSRTLETPEGIKCPKSKTEMGICALCTMRMYDEEVDSMCRHGKDLPRCQRLMKTVMHGGYTSVYE